MRILSALALLLGAAPLTAQTATPVSRPGEELVDRVVAVVGDTALLLSDVQFRVQQQLSAAGQPLPEDPVQRDRLGQQVMRQMVEDLMLVEAARSAGIVVADDEVRQQVDQQIRNILQNFGGSEERFTQALAASGLTREQYRRSLEEQVRDQELVRQYMQRQMANRARPLVSEDQLRAAFEQRRGSLGTRPATISLQQVIVKAQPSDSADARAQRTAREVLDELMTKNGDFEVLAKRFSADPGTKEQGGSLGWFKQGRGLVKEFEDVAFALRPGQTSGIVKSEFGYHIIRVDKVRGPERQIRHILIKPDVGPEDVTRARQRADSVATAIRGGASATVLARQFGTRAEEAEVTRIPLENLPPAYQQALASGAAGAVVGPIEVQSPTGSDFAVVKITERQEAGAYTLDDVRDQLAGRLQEQQMMEQLIADLRKEMFVRVLM